mmetsp:Transcript_99253/g.172271  ORF Transcript_99253/g.172271 Transcript_99253/m.172271 type:complete len:248 (-) Transcript_99253:152-895(-)
MPNAIGHVVATPDKADRSSLHHRSSYRKAQCANASDETRANSCRTDNASRTHRNTCCRGRSSSAAPAHATRCGSSCTSCLLARSRHRKAQYPSASPLAGAAEHNVHSPEREEKSRPLLLHRRTAQTLWAGVLACYYSAMGCPLSTARMGQAISLRVVWWAIAQNSPQDLLRGTCLRFLISLGRPSCQCSGHGNCPAWGAVLVSAHPVLPKPSSCAGYHRQWLVQVAGSEHCVSRVAPSALVWCCLTP